MRYAIISDIHGNVESLERALSLVQADDEVLCLGDIVGYGPNPNECIALLRQRVKHAVLGNHDLAALENFGVEYFNDAARAAIAWTQGVLSEESRVWLNGLSYEIRYPDFLMVHGAPGELLRVHLRQAHCGQSLCAHRCSACVYRPHAYRRVLGARA